MVTVHLTKAGHALKQRALDIPRQIASCIPLGLEDALQLKGLLERVLEP